jgi:hypothetical protein
MIKQREFRDCSYPFQGWMIEDMELYGNELIIYSILNSVCQTPGASYYGSKEYLGKFVGSTRTAIRVLNSLIEKGYVKKRVISGRKTEYIALAVKKKNRSSKKESDNLSVTNCHSDCDKMSHQYKNKYINKYIKKDRNKDPDSLPDKPNIPSLEEVKAYAVEMNLKFNPVKFYEYYQEKKWIKKNGAPVKSWKLTMCRWSDTEVDPKEKAAEAKTKNSFQQNEYDFEALERELRAN